MGREELKQAKDELQDINELLDKSDILPEVPGRILDILITVLSVFLALFHVYTGLTGLKEFYVQRGVHLFLVMVIATLILIREADKRYKIFGYLVLLFSVIVPFVYFYGDFSYFQVRLWGVGFRQSDIITGIILTIACFVLAQRSVGWVMPVITAISIIYLFIGPYCPGILQHGGYSLKFVTELCSWSEIGIFSTPLGVAAS